MSIIGKIIKWLVLSLVVALIGLAGWLWLLPPEKIRLAGAYSAKITCSNVYLAGRDMDKVMADDVQAPGHPLLKYFTVSNDGRGMVATRFLGLFATQYAVYRAGLGCASVPDGDTGAALNVKLAHAPVLPEPSDFEWPLGDAVTLAADEKVQAIIGDPAMNGPGMRAVVVVRDGRIIAETYGPGFAAGTPLLGWSMTKTVTGAITALRVAEGKLAWNKDHLLPEWEKDDRKAIGLSSLMAMEGGLVFNEEYGDVTDVTRMLFLEPDQAKYAAGLPVEAAPGKTFNYSTGTAVLISRIWMDTFASLDDARDYPRKALFGPIGMRSAIFETDSRGTFSGGSLLYATARDWARFGLLLVNDGLWNENRILPADYMAMLTTPTSVSKGRYTGALAWKEGPQDRPNSEFGLPDDLYWALGHDGQSLAIVPSQKLVIVRMGLTPGKLGYLPQVMIGKIVDVLAQQAAMPEPTPEESPPMVSDPDVQPDEGENAQ